METIQKVRLTWFLDNKKRKKCVIYTQIGNKNNSNSLEVIGIVKRKGVKGKGVIV